MEAPTHIRQVKTWARNEQERLEERRKTSEVIQEIDSLEGSLMAIKKLRAYLEGDE